MKPSRLALWLATATLLSACGGGDDDEGNALMRPGENCVSCHANFSVAGTVYPSRTAAANTGLAGVTVVVVDANGQQVTMASNAAGNFYTTAVLAQPLQSTYVVRNGLRSDMGGQPSAGCASAGCHDASRRVYAP